MSDTYEMRPAGPGARRGATPVARQIRGLMNELDAARGAGESARAAEIERRIADLKEASK